MTITFDPTVLDPTASAPTESGSSMTRRAAGWSAIGFAACVITGNVLIGTQPDRDATAGEITGYVTEHRGGLAISVACYALGAIFMLAFTSAFGERLRRRCSGLDRVFAGVGTRGGLLIVPMFAAVLVPRIALIVGTDETIADPTIVALLWRLEMAAFSLNTITLVGALLGLCIAGSRVGLVQRWLGVVGPIAALVGLVGVAASVAGLEGSIVGLAGIVPFVVWMLFLLTTGVRELRRTS